MRPTKLLLSGTLGALLLAPAGVSAQDPEVTSLEPAGSLPTLTLRIPAYTPRRSVSVRLSPVIPSGTSVKGYYLSEDPETPAPGASGWSLTPTSFTLSDADGPHTVYAWVKVTGGIVSPRAEDATFLDRQDPTVEFDVVPTTSPTRTVAISLVGDDPGYLDPATVAPTGSGISRWAVVNGTTQPSSSSSAWVTTPPTSHRVTVGNGEKTVSAFARDRAGNVSLVATDTVTLAIPAPSLVLSIPEFTQTAKVKVKLTATDNSGTGIIGYYLSTSPTRPAANASGWLSAPTTFTFSTPKGSKTLYAWAKDNNNAVSETASDSTFWDDQDPVAHLEVTSEAPITSRTIDVSAEGTDPTAPVSGVTHFALVNGTTVPGATSSAWKTSAPTTFVLPARNGSKTISLFVRDAAGNTSAASTRTVTLAIPAPVIETFDLPSLARRRGVSVTTLSVSDPGGTGIAGYFVSESDTPPTAGQTGWLGVLSSVTLSSGDGRKTVNVWVKDQNGSVSDPASDTIRLDTTPPLATLTVGTGNSLTVGGSDNGGSGVTHWAIVFGTFAPNPTSDAWVTSPTSATITLRTGTNVVSAFTRDAAGNVSDPATRTIVVP